MFHGVPPIVANVGEHQDIIDHGQNGFLLTERTPEAFSSIAVELRKNPGLYVRISDAARKTALTYDLASAAKRWQQIVQVASDVRDDRQDVARA